MQGDYAYNIEQGANILASSVVTVNVNSGNSSSNGQPIDQYLRLWAYNGYSDDNNPSNNLRYNPDRNWDESKRVDCPLSLIGYPYQEKILYEAKCNPNVDGLITWPAIDDFPLPDDTLFASDLDTGWGPTRDILIFDSEAKVNCIENHISFQYTLQTTQTVTTQVTIHDNKPWLPEASHIKTLPVGDNTWDGTNENGQAVPIGEYWFTVAVSNTTPQLIGLQSNPVRIACLPLYLPIMAKNYPPLYFLETFNPIHSDWEFYNNDPQNEVENYIYITSNEGHDDSHALFMTEQIGLFSYTSGGRFRLIIPPTTDEVFLTFWVKRVGEHGAYRVLVDDQVVASEVSTAAIWQQQTADITFAAADGELNLHFQVPSQFLTQAVFFDNIKVVGR